MPEPLIRLDVWRPARIERRLVYDGIGNCDPHAEELQEDRLYEQVYSWKIRGDVWTSLGDDGTAKEIRDSITEEFACSLSPADRGLSKIKSAKDRISEYLRNDENRKWQEWEQPISDDDPNNLYRLQPLVAFCHHLKWLLQVFKDVPGASVTISTQFLT